MSSVSPSQNTSPSPAPINHLKRRAESPSYFDYDVDQHLEDLKKTFEEHLNKPNLPVLRLLNFYQILTDLNSPLEVEISDSDSDSDIITNPDHGDCLLGKIQDPSKAIQVASKIQDYLLRNEALFCSVISHPDFKDPSKQEDYLDHIQNIDFQFYAHSSYYLTLIGDSNALPDDQLTSTFVDEMLDKLEYSGSRLTDRMYSSLALACAKRNKCDMAIKIMDKIQFEQDRADTQFEAIEIIIGHHPGSNRDDLPTLNKLLEIANGMPEDVDFYEAYYTKSIIKIAVALQQRGNTSLIESGVDWFLRAKDEEWLEDEEIIQYGGIVTKSIIELAVAQGRDVDRDLIHQAVIFLNDASIHSWLIQKDLILLARHLRTVISHSRMEDAYKCEFIAGIITVLEPLCTHEGG